MQSHIERQIMMMGQEVAKLYQGGLYEKALSLAMRCCELAKQYIGKNHPHYVTCLNNIAEIYRAMGRYAEAEPIYIEALEITRRNAGPTNPFVTRTLNNYAALKYNMSNYKEAASLYQEALQILRINRIENYPDVANGKSGLAETYRMLGNYAEAERLHKEALEIRREFYKNQNHPDLGNSLHNLAELYRTIGRYDEARRFYREALRVFEKDYPQYYAVSLNGLSGLHKSMGKFVEAETGYREAREIMRKTYGENHPNYATAIHNLAELYRTMGNYTAAKPLCQKALEIRLKSLKRHPDLAASLITESLLLYDEKKFLEALPPLERAHEILVDILGKNHSSVAIILDNKAVLFRALGHYEDAIQVYRQAQEIFRQSVGEKHPDFALNLLNIAGTYHEMGNYSEAEPLYRRAIELYRAARGENHKECAFGLYSLARLMVATKNVSEAFSLLKKAAEIDDRMIGQIFLISSEQQRMTYLRDEQQNFDVYLSLVTQCLSKSAEAVRSALDFVLRRKAIGAEALATQRDAILGGRYPELEPGLKQLTTLRMQIATKTLAGPGSEGLEQHQRLLREWNQQKEYLESELARQIPEMNLEQKLRAADIRAVAQTLPEGVSLVEFARFNDLDFHAIAAKRQPLWKRARYAAFVLPSKEPDNVRMIDLGEAEPIDYMITTFRESIMRDPESRGARDLGAAHQEARPPSTRVGEKLRTVIFDPLLKALDGCRRLLLAPDSDLTQLPFEVLPLGDGRYLIDDYHISYLSTGRDVLRFSAPSTGQFSEPLVAADPDFDLEKKGTDVRAKSVEPRGRQSRELARDKMHFERLPGTRAEGERIAEMLEVKPWLEGTVLESKLKDIHSPRILHLATHGFFLRNQPHDLNEAQRGMGAVGWKANTEISRLSGMMLENPLLRSGIVLAGANTWLKRGSLLEEAEDGILTAEDVSGLDLLTTDLVVLSACDTGRGEVRTGEGVFGLRRAFVLAGAKTLVMSLWSVPDEQTQELMENFYRRILSRQPRIEALREAQLAMKAKYHDPYYWGAFICQGDASPLPEKRKRK